MESHWRSIVKALSWRVIAFLITFFVALALTGETHLAVGIGFTDSVIKIAAYYGHERVWFRVRFGRMKPPDFSI